MKMIGSVSRAMPSVLNPSLRRYLLKKNDYMIVSTQKAKYLFLSDSLRYFKITDRSVDAYLGVCQTGGASKTSLTEKEIISIGNFLSRNDNHETISPQDNGHDFLILNLTNACNLTCTYCFTETTKNHRTMTFEVAEKAIQAMIKQNKSNEYSIYFFGGEPLMQKKLVKQITMYAYEEIVTKKKGKVTFLLNTNATLIDDEIIQLFRKYDFKVTVSLDGPMPQHNKNRVYASGKGSFEKVVESINALKKNRVRTDIKATFSPDTEDLVSVFSFFESLQLPYFYSFTISADYKMNTEETYFEEEQFIAAEKELRKVMDFFFSKMMRGETIYYSGLNQKLAILKYKLIRSHSCEAGRKSLTVDEQGNYYACQNMIPYKQTIIGNVNWGVSETQKHLYRSEDVDDLNECNYCTIRNLCAGGCMVGRCNSNGKTHRQMCRLFHIEWQNLLYFYALINEIKKN